MPNIQFNYPETVQIFTSGSSNYGATRYFQVSGANATAGATYTNNGNTFTVSSTISSGQLLAATCTTAFTLSGNILTKTSGTGDATIQFNAVVTPTSIEVEMSGGGGGGASGNSSSSGLINGQTGGGTNFGATTANGGQGGQQGTGGVGGAPVIGSGATKILAFTGGAGGTIPNLQATSGGAGGSNSFGGSGLGGFDGNNGSAGATNSGAGGGGAGAINGSYLGGAGGGAGAYLKIQINNPNITYSYSIGAGGTGGAGTGTQSGGNGASGIIVVREFFNA